MNLEYSGQVGSWTEVARDLVEQRILSERHLETISKLDIFGELIANTDRHNGNLSFYFDDLKLGDLAPVYDMLPMLYMPHQGQMVQRKFSPSLP